MNGVRSTYMRKGYLLTALAAAVLLAASSGTAYAQSVGFVGTSATMGEGASPAATTPEPVTVEINVSGLTLVGATENAEDGLGTLSIRHDADDEIEAGEAGSVVERTRDARRIWVDSRSSALDEAEFLAQNEVTEVAAQHGGSGKGHLYGIDDATILPYDDNGVIRLILIDPAFLDAAGTPADNNWQDDTYTMRLITTEAADANPASVPTPSPADFKVTVVDNSAQPTIEFSTSSLVLTERSVTVNASPIMLFLEAGNRKTDRDNPAGIGALTSKIQFVASPADAVVIDATPDDGMSACDPDSDTDVISLTLTGIMRNPTTKVFTVDANAGDIVGDDIGDIVAEERASFTVEACGRHVRFPEQHGHVQLRREVAEGCADGSW